MEMNVSFSSRVFRNVINSLMISLTGVFNTRIISRVYLAFDPSSLATDCIRSNSSSFIDSGEQRSMTSSTSSKSPIRTRGAFENPAG